MTRTTRAQGIVLPAANEAREAASMWLLIIVGAGLLASDKVVAEPRSGPRPLEVFGFAFLAIGLFVGALHR